MPKVYVIDMGRKFFGLRWTDHTGRVRSKSSKCTRRREAERAAAELEKQLTADEMPQDGSMQWHTFVDRLGVEHLSGLAPATRDAMILTLTQLENIVKPFCLRDVTSHQISRFVGERRKHVAEATIKKDLSHIKSAFRWAVAAKYLPSCPSIPTIRRAHRSSEAKGRPLTPDEFQAMLNATASVVGNYPAASWQRLLRGLWLSGLRISEAINLHWNPGPWPSLDIADPQRPVMLIPGGRQKSGREQRLPLTPDFGQFVATETDRDGYVFRQFGERGWHIRSRSTVVHTISAIGKASGVVVDASRDSHPTAHDLRRSFGARWSVRVMPAVLKELMRHAVIETTLKYYVGQSIARTHDAVHDALMREKGISLGITDADDRT